MALFFDAAWFDARLAAAGLTRDSVAAALGLSRDEVAEIWKDQRQLATDDVRILAALLGAPPEDVVLHAGVSTPLPPAASPDIEKRLARLERELEAIKQLLAARRTRTTKGRQTS